MVKLTCPFIKDCAFVTPSHLELHAALSILQKHLRRHHSASIPQQSTETCSNISNDQQPTKVRPTNDKNFAMVSNAAFTRKQLAKMKHCADLYSPLSSPSIQKDNNLKVIDQYDDDKEKDIESPSAKKSSAE